MHTKFSSIQQDFEKISLWLKRTRKKSGYFGKNFYNKNKFDFHVFKDL